MADSAEAFQTIDDSIFVVGGCQLLHTSWLDSVFIKNNASGYRTMVSLGFVFHCVADEVVWLALFAFECQVRVYCLRCIVVTGRNNGHFEIQIVRVSVYCWYLPFYAIGYFGRKYQNLWEKQGHKVALCLFVLFLFMAYWWMRKDAPLFLPQNSHVIYNYVYKFAVAIVAIAALVPLFRYYIDDKMLMITKLGG